MTQAQRVGTDGGLCDGLRTFLELLADIAVEVTDPADGQAQGLVGIIPLHGHADVGTGRARTAQEPRTRSPLASRGSVAREQTGRELVRDDERVIAFPTRRATSAEGSLE